MRLSDAASFFDRTVCADAYTPTNTFVGQLGLFDDSMRDGTTVLRRVLSVGPDVALPARGAVTIHGETFVVGGFHADSFDGEVIRKKYVLHRADGLANLRTADQALRTLAGTDLYAGRVWVKDLREVESSSRLSSFLDVYVSATETVTPGRFLFLAGRWHIIRNALVSAAGILTMECDELPVGCLAAASYTARSGGAYDAASDSVPGVPTAPNLLVHRWQDDYFYHQMSAARFGDGDVVAHLSQASVAAAKTGDSFIFGGITYRVLSVRDDTAGAWVLHGRRD